MYIKSKKTKTAIISGATLLVSAGFIIGIGGFFGRQTIPSDTFTRGLVGYWSFEEGFGDKLYDASGRGNHGDWHGISTHWTTGKHGGAGEFNGVNDYVDCGSDPSLNFDASEQYTWEYWVKPNIGEIMCLSAKPSSSVSGYEIRIIATGELTFENGVDWKREITTFQVSTGVWYHVVFFYDNGSVTIYVNGDEKTSTNNFVAAFVDNTATDFDISYRHGRYFNGSIDEVRIYNRALSAEEIRYHYNRGAPVGHWKMDEGAGTTAYDTSDNNNNGTISGATWVVGKHGTALDFDGNDYVQATVSQTKTTYNCWYDPGSGWQHLVKIGTDYYINSSLVSSPPVFPIYTSGDTIQIGKNEAGSFVSGKVDDVRIYNYARTPNEIQLDYNAGLMALLGSGSYDINYGLTGYWSMDEGGGTTASDGSGQEHHAVITTLYCPDGYIPVPGNPTYGTSDFCVMKYEAKYDKDGDGDGDDASPNCVASSGDGWDWTDSGCSTGGTVVSSADGSPIVHITHTQAVSACPTGSHLITNDEWMTIARNAEQVAINWTGGSVGSGCLYRGNTGTGAPCAAAAYNAVTDPDKGTGRDSKAKLTLSNGEEIWDISGNVWEHVNFDLISLAQQPEAASSTTRTGWGWTGFNSDDLAAAGGCYLENNGDFDDDGDSDIDDYNVFRPSDSSWDANEGMGRIYHYSNSSTLTKSYVFLRGGDWGDDAGAGAFALLLSWGVSTQHYYVGLRCVR